MLRTLTRGLDVRRPDGEAPPPAILSNGGVSVGAGHLPSVGGVIYLCLHDAGGETLMLTLGQRGYRDLALAMNAAADQIENGAFDGPEVAQ